MSKISVSVSLLVFLFVRVLLSLFCSLLSRSVHARCFRNAETFLIFFFEHRNVLPQSQAHNENVCRIFFQDESNFVSLKLPKKKCFCKFYERAKGIIESFEDDLNSKFKLHFLQEIHQIVMKIVIIVMKIMKIDIFLASITITNGYEIISLCVFLCVRVMCTNSYV